MPDGENHTPSQIWERLSIARSGEDLSIESWKKLCERPEGLLTDKQRRFLQGVLEYTGDNARQERYGMRQRIRRRYVQGIQDLSFLRSLDKGSRDTIVEELGEAALLQFSAELLEFIYVQTENQDLLNKIHEIAVYNALRNNPGLRESSMDPLDVEVSTDVNYSPGLVNIIEQVEEAGFESLQPEEAGYLVQNLRVANPAILELYQNILDEHSDQPDADLDQLNEIEVDVSELIKFEGDDSEE